MNIFYLHEDPTICASYFYDKHKVKMILECAQMLCTAHRHYGNDEVPYKKAHYNHPSTIWARENHYQYQWLYWHMIALGDEYTKRYNKEHLSIIKCKECLSFSPYGIRLGKFNQPPQCMPEQYKHEDTITAYWNYYIAEKSNVANKNELLYKKPFVK